MSGILATVLVPFGYVAGAGIGPNGLTDFRLVKLLLCHSLNLLFLIGMMLLMFEFRNEKSVGNSL